MKMKRKVKIRTVLFFMLAVVTVISIFKPADDEESLYQYTWADAVYVKDGKVLPENEGKLVAVAGSPEMIEGAYDKEIGVHFPSPSVYRVVYIIKYSFMNDMGEDNSGYYTRRTYEGSSEDGLESKTLVGRVGIGEFELDEMLTKELGVVRKDVTFSTFSEEDADHMLEHWNESSYGGRFCITETTSYLDLDNIEKETSYDPNDYEGDRFVWWSMWVPSPEDKFTVVGIQKGNKLTYCEDLKGSSSKEKIVTEEKMKKKEEPANPVLVKIMGIGFAVLFAWLGVRSMSEHEKKSRKE